METRIFSYKHSSISYLRFGDGPRLVVCFHGYGEQASGFGFLEKVEGFTFIAIDLPFHGSTKWNDKLNFTGSDLTLIVQGILAHEGLWEKNMTLLGFSLGGRVSLSLFELMPDRIERMVLLAPDGLKLNFWYWLSTQTLIGKKAFSFTMHRPGWFFALLNLLNRLRLVNPSVYKFVNYYIDDKQARMELYKRWIVLRKLRPDRKKIKKLIKSRNIPVRLIYGKHDKIILPVRGEKFSKGIEENCTITIIPSGHQVLHAKYAEEIRAALHH